MSRRARTVTYSRLSDGTWFRGVIYRSEKEQKQLFKLGDSIDLIDQPDRRYPETHILLLTPSFGFGRILDKS